MPDEKKAATATGFLAHPGAEPRRRRTDAAAEGGPLNVGVEMTELLTPAGGASRLNLGRKKVVKAESLRAALLRVLGEEGGRILGTITESERRAVCTGWIEERLFLVVAQEEPYPDSA